MLQMYSLLFLPVRMMRLASLFLEIQLLCCFDFVQLDVLLNVMKILQLTLLVFDQQIPDVHVMNFHVVNQ